MDLSKKDSSFYLNGKLESKRFLIILENTGQQTNHTVLMTYGYDKEKLNGKKIVNGNFEILEKLGEGTFWTVYKVERSVINESINNKSLHVFKEGNLNFISPDDKIFEEIDIPEVIPINSDVKKNEKNEKSFEDENESKSDNTYYQNINDLDFLYSDEILKTGMQKIY